MKPIFVAALGMLIFAAAATTTLHAQVGKGTSAGVYTAQQASRGAELYQSKCSTCHGAELAGDGTAPPLAGPAFATHWAGQPVASLFDMIHLAMPSDQPGTLTGQQTADLIAFLLSSNKFPAGQTELPAVTDQLQEILIDTAP